jgi:glycine/D-amino acid oxidase-like deaminating enzyme
MATLLRVPPRAEWLVSVDILDETMGELQTNPMLRMMPKTPKTPKTRYDVSPWLDGVPKSRRPSYPRLRGHHDAEVVIVGGGLVGCLTAHALASAGISVVLLEAAAVGEATTAHGPGLALLEPQVGLPQAVRAHGTRTANRLWQSGRRGGQNLAASLERLGVRCELTKTDLLEVALDVNHERELGRALEARTVAGLPVTRLTARALRERTGLVAAGALKVPGNLTLDPYKACIGVARDAVRRGARVFQGSRARRITSTRHVVEVRTGHGAVEAETIVIATGTLPAFFEPLRRHLAPMETYGVMTAVLPPTVRRELGRRDAVIRDSMSPPRYLRWTRDHRVLVTGADQPPVARSRRPKTLAQRTGQLMYELSTLYPAISGVEPAYGWSASYDRTKDELPIVGPHRSYPRHLFALGLAHGGLGLAFLASRILVRACQGESAEDDDVFGFGRLR